MENLFIEFINVYGPAILNTILVGIGGWLAVVIKNFLNEVIKDKRVKSVIKTVVKGVEQIYKDLHGEEKLNKALEAAAEMLAEKGITLSAFEMRMMIEAAVGEFNGVFTNGAEEAAG